MAGSVNKVILIGRTGADTELKYTSSGKAVANFSLAINDSFKNRDGEQTERVEWVRCVAWESFRSQRCESERGNCSKR